MSLPRAFRLTTGSLVVIMAVMGAVGARAAPSEERQSHLYRPELPNARPASAPKRIISLAPVLTESLFALDLGDRVVGVTRYCDRPQEALLLPKVGGYVDPQLETILGLKPDLVVAMPSFGQRQVLDRLRERGVPVLVAFGDSVAEIRGLVTTMGEFTGRDVRAATVVKRLDDGLNAVRSKYAKVKKRPRAVVIYQVEPIVVAGPGTFPDEALRIAGAEPASPAGAPAWPTWSLESLLAVSPDVIVVAEGPAAAARMRARLSALEGRPRDIVVVSHEGPMLMRPGPTLHEDVALLARLLSTVSPPAAKSPP